MPASAVSSQWAHAGLQDLFRRLRGAGIPVGTAQALDAGRLVRTLLERDAGLAVTRLRGPLRTAICKSAVQQRGFDAVFDAWASTLVQTWRRSDSDAPQHPSDAAHDLPAPSRRRPSAWWLASAAVVLLLLAWFAWIKLSISPAPAVQPPKPAASTPVPVQASSPTVPVASAPSDQAPIVAYAPLVVYRSELRPELVWALLAPGALLLALLGFDLAARQLGGMQSRDAQRPARLGGWSRQDTARRALSPLADDSAERLHRHVSGPAEELHRLERRPQLHVRRTVEATLRQLGLPAERFRAARLVPSYLILVEADNPDDYALLWAERLKQAHLHADLRRIVLRDGTPAVVPWDAPPTAPAMPLAGLPAPPWGQRLVVVSSGAWVARPEGGASAAFLQARFQRWPQRVFFTPHEPRRWGANEDLIEAPGDGNDPGFLLLPIDENAVDGWTRWLASGHLPAIELESPQHYPRLLHDLPESAWLADEPPADVSQLVAQLKRYLGPNGFYWLACCAVPPLLHPQVTLQLGDAFLRIGGSGEEDTARLMARNYRLLLRLPWLRRQHMPAWLRVVLLGSLPKPVQHEVQAAVRALLARQTPDAAGSLMLSFEAPPQTGLASRSPPGAAGDMLYLGFMSGVAPRDLALQMPAAWQRWIHALDSRRPRGVWSQGWRRGTALLRRLRFRRGLPVLGLRRWPQQALAAWALLLLPTLAVLDGPAAPHAPGDERRAAFRERADRIEMRHADWVPSAQFSPDGTRVVTASSDGSARVWDARSGQPIGALLKHEGWVWSAQFSPDGTRVVTASDDGSARVWGRAQRAADRGAAEA